MLIDGIELVISGRLFRTARLRNEWYDFTHDPEAFVEKLREVNSGADVFTFLQEIPCRPLAAPRAAGRLPASKSSPREQRASAAS